MEALPMNDNICVRRRRLHNCLIFGNAMLSLKNYSTGNTSLHNSVTSDKEA